MQVSYVDHMGSDLSVVNAARVSHAKKSDWEFVMPTNPLRNQYPIKRLKKSDNQLVNFLARGCTSGEWDKLLEEFMDTEFYDDLELLVGYIRQMPTHWTPFGHTAVTVHVQAPIFVARQLGKHQVGFVWNEVSRRYVDDPPHFYVPKTFRKKAKDVKQGSGAPVSSTRQNLAAEHLEDAHHVALFSYNKMLEMGVCAEQARMVLPQSMYTEWYWTGNLYGFAQMFKTRTFGNVQQETKDVANMIGDIIRPLYPVSWQALTGEV